MPGAAGFRLAGLVAFLDGFWRLTRGVDAVRGRPDFRPAGGALLAGLRELGGIEGLDAVDGRVFFVWHGVFLVGFSSLKR